MPFSNNSKRNKQSNKKLKRNQNHKNLMVSPEATLRDAPEVDRRSIEQVTIEVSEVSVSSYSQQKRKSKKSAPRQQNELANHNKQKLLGDKKMEVTVKNIIPYQEMFAAIGGDECQDAKDGPCAKCREYYFEPLYDEETEVARIRQRAFNQRVKSKRRNRRQRLIDSDQKNKKSNENHCHQRFEKLKRLPIPGCDDSHIGPLTMYKVMLRQEREHFEKINNLVYQRSFDGILTKIENGVIKENNGEASTNVLQSLEINSIQNISDSFCNDSFDSQARPMRKMEITMPQQGLCDLRNKIVEKIIFGVSSRLKLKNLTQHLAVKLFDLVFVNQQQFIGNHEEAVERALSLASATKESLKDMRNSEKNLSLLATQCILLASKFMETTRIYPAEVVYQVKGWGKEDFELLQSGQIEEYILQKVNFDVMMMSPMDFIEYFTLSWNTALPVAQCSKQQITNKIKDFWQVQSNLDKLKLYSHQVCNLMVQNLGPQISLLYLPSQVATAAISLAMQSIMETELQGKANLDTDTLSAFFSESSKIIGYVKDQLDSGIQQLISEAKEVELIRRHLGFDESTQEEVNKQATQDTMASGCNDSPFEVAEQVQEQKSAANMSNQLIRQEKALTSTRKSLGAARRSLQSTSRRNSVLKLPKISMENLYKFEQHKRNRKNKREQRNSMLSDFLSVDSSVFEGGSDSAYAYPKHVNTELENNYIITNRFFGHGKYRNTKNYLILRQSLKKDEQKILPTLEVVQDIQSFYGNAHFELQAQSRGEEVRYLNLLDTPQDNKKNCSEATFCSNQSSTASKKADKENENDWRLKGAQLLKRDGGRFLHHASSHLECDPSNHSFKSDDMGEIVQGNLRPLYAKNPDDDGFSDVEVKVFHGRNTFEDEEYMRLVNEDSQRLFGLGAEVNHHYSLIPKALQEQQCMSDFEYNSNDVRDESQGPFFCHGSNFILSQQPSQLVNFQPAPRHSMPQQYLNLAQLENMIGTRELELTSEKDEMIITENEEVLCSAVTIHDTKNGGGQQSSTTNSSGKLLTAGNANVAERRANIVGVDEYIPLRGPKRRECFV